MAAVHARCRKFGRRAQLPRAKDRFLRCPLLATCSWPLREVVAGDNVVALPHNDDNTEVGRSFLAAFDLKEVRADTFHPHNEHTIV
jgi:hypothetical protein